jgi:hypothetical protein
MREGKLREILEECLTAVFDGRRTVEDCLSLYPSFASELEPLLRTALEVSDTYQAQSPPWHVQERIRHRVLASATARARSRTIVAGVNLSPNSWRTRHWGGLGIAAAAAVAAVFMVSVMLIGGSGGNDGPVTVGNDPLPVTVEPLVADFQSDVERLDQLLTDTGRVDPVVFIDVQESFDAVAKEYPNFAAFSGADEPTQQAALETLAKVDEILSPVVEQAPEVPELADARNLLGEVQTLTADWGEPEPVTPVPTDDPELTETPAPTDTPIETEAPEPSPTKVPSETPEATEPAEATETPSPGSDPVHAAPQ